MKKTISKIIVYYSDGTYEEVKTSISDAQNQPHSPNVTKTPVSPDFRPDWQKIREWNPSMPYGPHVPTYVSPGTGDPSLPPWTITCSTTGENLNWKVTSTGNDVPFNKYTITSTGNGNVEVSK